MALDGRPVYVIEQSGDWYDAMPVYVVDPEVVGVYGGTPVEVIDPEVRGYYAGAPVYLTDNPSLGLWVYAVSGTLGGALISLSDTSVDEDAAVGTAVGTLSVSGGSGTYTYTLTDSAGGKFALDGPVLETNAALDYETAATHSITVEADNGVDDPVERTFTIFVGDITEYEAPGWVPESALIYISPATNHYYANGAERTLAEMFYEDQANWGEYSDADVTGDGLYSGAGYSAPLIETAMIPADLLSGDMAVTVVVEFELGDDTSAIYIVVADEAADDVSEFAVVKPESLSRIRISRNNSANEDLTLGGDFPVGLHKAAITFDPDYAAASVDGLNYARVNEAVQPTFEIFGIWIEGHCTITKLTVFPAVADADLPELSAFGPPVNFTAPAISGTETEGETLTVGNGDWAGELPITYSHQWFRAVTVETFSPEELFAGGEGGFWFDPSDLASQFQDSAGTTPAAVDSPVGKANDKSGNAAHVIQAINDVRRPTLRQSGGTYYWEFTQGGNFHSLYNTTEVVGLTNFTFFVVCSEDTELNRAAILNIRPTTPTDGFSNVDGILFHTGMGAEHFGAIGASDYTLDAAAAGAGTTPLAVWQVVKNGAATVKVYKNGVEEDSLASFTNLTSPSGGGFIIGTNWQGFAAAPVFTGKIYGMLYIDRLLTTDENTAMIDYLTDKMS